MENLALAKQIISLISGVLWAVLLLIIVLIFVRILSIISSIKKIANRFEIVSDIKGWWSMINDLRRKVQKKTKKISRDED
jgi:hypothetical protein